MLICIDAGHYLGTPGKRCLKSIDPNETREWALNSRVADKVQERLTDYDCQTMRVDDTTGQKEVTLYQRVQRANKARADVYLSIHHNAGIKGGSGGGIVVYTCPVCQAKSKDLQRSVYDATVASTGLRGNRSAPLGTAEFYVLNKTTMPAILGEFGFMDSTTDTPVILTEEYADKLADGIVAGLVDCLGLKKDKVAGPSVVVACDVSDFAIEMVNAAKTTCGTNYANAGYFGRYGEGGEDFTLPAAHLVCDYKASSRYVRKYCEERGRFNGDKFTFDSGIWSYDNPLYGKKVTTLYIRDGLARVEELDHAPQADYAVSGIPVIRNGAPVDRAEVRAQGWDASSCRAAWHTFLGLKDDSIIYIMGWKSTSSDLIQSGEAAWAFTGFSDVIKLDGGGSYYLDRNGEVSTSGGDRLINNIIRFVPKEDDTLTYEQWVAYMERYRKELGAKEASPWAVPYIQEAIDAGLMADVGGSIERPRDFVTRQELATVAVALKK